MTASHTPSVSLSEEEAKKEHDDIQAEIARSKGIKPEGDDDPSEDKGKDVEPGKSDDEVDPKKEDPTKDEEDLDPEDVDPEEEEIPKTRKPSLLGKYQNEKKDREAAQARVAELEQSVAKLTDDLNRTKTADQLKDKVKAYAEKHGMSEEAAMDLVLLAKEGLQPDSETKSILQESKVLIQKNKANQDFESEFSKLIVELPEAEQVRDKIRQAAFKDENLSRSLFEIFHRLQRDTTPAKKKTGEAPRGAIGRDATVKTFDVKAVAEKVKSGQSGSLQGLSGEQQDEVFAYLDKEGSRYQR